MTLDDTIILARHALHNSEDLMSDEREAISNLIEMAQEIRDPRSGRTTDPMPAEERPTEVDPCPALGKLRAADAATNTVIDGRFATGGKKWWAPWRK